jgi:hypothetical protein
MVRLQRTVRCNRLLGDNTGAQRVRGVWVATVPRDALSTTSAEATRVCYAHPSCCRLMLSFQIFVMWRILSPSNCITYT